jgi:hypothetical protein
MAAHTTIDHQGLFEGSPKQVLSKEQALALFRENQRGRTLTRVPGGQFQPTPKKPDLTPSLVKKAG